MLRVLNVTCHRCGAAAPVATLAEVGSLRLCRCCPEDHDHDAMANAGFPCRPVHIEMPEGYQHAAMLSGGGEGTASQIGYA